MSALAASYAIPSWAARRFARALDDALAVPDDGLPTFTPGYRPHPRQAAFHYSDARFRLYGGAAGGGKTRALREECIRQCLAQHGLNVYLFRRTYRELEESHILAFRQEVPADWYSYNESRHVATFRRTGSRIWFRYCDNANDTYGYQSAEFDLLAIDETGHLPGDWLRYLWSRMRSTATGRQARFIGATNPGGPGHSFLKRLFVDRDADYAEAVAVDLAELAFIPARLADNPTLLEREPSYVRRLDALPEAERKALRDGDWNTFVGQYFTAWRRDLHVTRPWAIPDTWPRVRAIDYGGTAPFCCLWLARDPAYPATPHEARIYAYREHYEGNRSLKWHVDQVLRLSPAAERYRATVADPSIWARTQELPDQRSSLERQIRAMGLVCKPGARPRVPGWEIIAQLLELRADGKPGLRIFDTCPNLVRTLPEMQRDKTNVEDCSTDGEDHAPDGLRWGVQELLGRAGDGAPEVGMPTRAVTASRGRAW